MQHQVEAGCERPARLVDMLVKHAPDHDADQQQLQAGTAEVEHRAQPVAALAQKEYHQPGQQGARHHQQWQPSVQVHALASSSVHTGAPARPSSTAAAAPSSSAGHSSRANVTTWVG